MSSGLTRRRGGGGGGNDGEGSHAGTPTGGPSDNNARLGPETNYETSENGHKIAFDPRDISESAERSKQPKLTLMEEVLLLGLKDKQVWVAAGDIGWASTDTVPPRDTFLSGTTTSPML